MVLSRVAVVVGIGHSAAHYRNHTAVVVGCNHKLVVSLHRCSCRSGPSQLALSHQLRPTLDKD